ncbi:sugar phosphate isomerase/epimerase family protein [Halovenus marina]|uniref:sugar phosphate isomerase/epimerase family protein n=1 Tax=Halovenus marina TaxID=3396621 RepID=UPI003F550012
MTMQFGLLSVSYSGLWHDGPGLSLEEQIEKADEMGYDAISIETKRPTAFPLDFDAEDRQRLKETADDAGIDICAVESMSNFASPYHEERENNLAMMHDVLEFAADLDVDLVKVFPAWPGIKDDHAETAIYGEMPMRSHWETRYPGTEDYRQWNRCVEGIREVADWAAERDITLAVQNHPPVLAGGYEDALQLVEEIDRENVGLCLDAVLFYERQSDEYIREAVQACADHIELSHYGAWNFTRRDGEVVQTPSPLSGELINNEEFVRQLDRIGYDGYLLSEYCVPCMEDHELQGIEAIDEANEMSLSYMEAILESVQSEEPVPAED